MTATGFIPVELVGGPACGATSLEPTATPILVLDPGGRPWSYRPAGRLTADGLRYVYEGRPIPHPAFEGQQ